MFQLITCCYDLGSPRASQSHASPQVALTSQTLSVAALICGALSDPRGQSPLTRANRCQLMVQHTQACKTDGLCSVAAE